MPEDDSYESKHVAKIIIYVILKLSKYINVVVLTEIYCRFTINRLSYHTTG